MKAFRLISCFGGGHYNLGSVFYVLFLSRLFFNESSFRPPNWPLSYVAGICPPLAGFRAHVFQMRSPWMSASAALEQSHTGKISPNTDVYRTFWGLVRWFPAPGEPRVRPLYLWGGGQRAGQWSCEFLRDCLRCVHRSVCLFHVCSPSNIKHAPGTARCSLVGAH